MATELFLDFRRYLQFEGKQLPTGKPPESLLVSYFLTATRTPENVDFATLLIDMVVTKEATFSDEQLSAIENALADIVFIYTTGIPYEHIEDISASAHRLFTKILPPLLKHPHTTLQQVGMRVANRVIARLAMHPVNKRTHLDAYYRQEYKKLLTKQNR